MTTTAADQAMTRSSVEILTDQPVSTWFKCGGRAERFARPATIDQLRECLGIDANLRVLGDGANLLVADSGVRELVVELSEGKFAEVVIDERTGIVDAGGGVKLPQLITETVRRGLSGLETLGGIPATVGGAAAMNAGGAFGQFGDCVQSVTGLSRDGKLHELSREKVIFDYRRSDFAGLRDFIVTRVRFKLAVLAAGDTSARVKLKDVMEYKKRTQPMAADSAGCCFKNPTLSAAVEGIGAGGARVSAGLLIDRAGCKGLRIGSAEVSDRHANFFVAHAGCTAGDLIALMREVRRRVHDRFGVTIEPEVKVWGEVV
ncbi:MAG: UDP-N-acetylmuramate dehydrogenase [Phycisphaerales bacterium]|nr:UDP-N-acetylmuramate dehydrogenase [Phycisphaerales bacterium]